MNHYIPLDVIDKKLLRQLQKDGRTTYAEMGQMVGLTAPAVRARIERMKDNGVVRIVAVTSPTALGYAEAAIVGLRVDGDARLVADELAKLSNLVWCIMTVGGYDLMCGVVCIDREEFAMLLHERIRSIDGVRSADAFPYTDMPIRFNWAIPD